MVRHLKSYIEPHEIQWKWTNHEETGLVGDLYGGNLTGDTDSQDRFSKFTGWETIWEWYVSNGMKRSKHVWFSKPELHIFWSCVVRYSFRLKTNCAKFFQLDCSSFDQTPSACLSFISPDQAQLQPSSVAQETFYISLQMLRMLFLS